MQRCSEDRDRAVTVALLHGVEFSAPWYSAHDRQGRVVAVAQTLEALRAEAPDAHSYRERYDRGKSDRWAPARTLDLFTDHCGGAAPGRLF